MTDLPDVIYAGTHRIGHILHRYSYVGSYGLLYLEESGVPLPAPGDLFVMYVGAFIPVVLGRRLAQPTASPSVPREL